MVGALFVITDLMFGFVGGVVVTLLMTVFFAGMWFALPFWYRRNNED
jgi:hypothetical protein